jgi:hypothetical protein
MKNVGEIIFEQRPGEADADHAQRCDGIKRQFEAVFNNEAGIEVLRMLYAASHPLAPRFAAGRSSEEAAFLDGERSLIGFLWLNATSLQTF